MRKRRLSAHHGGDWASLDWETAKLVGLFCIWFALRFVSTECVGFKRASLARAHAMASRWSYRGADSWIPGQNIPAVGRGGSHRQSLNAAGIQFFGNCITDAAKLPHAVQKEIYTALTGHRRHPKVDAVTVVSVLGAVSLKTARSWHQTLEEKGWSAGFTVGTPESCLASTQEAVGSFPEMVDMDALPEVLPAVVDAAEIDTDSDLDLDRAPDSGIKPRCEVWREHPNYCIGMRLTELCTMWLVQGWQAESFTKFTYWLGEQAPGIIGNLNHSGRWLRGFQASLIQACHTCTATSLHAILPATGLPSLLSRVIDVVSIHSASLLPVIHVYTSTEGKLVWSLLACPCLERTSTQGEGTVGDAAAVGVAAAVGAAPASSTRTRWFGLHSAEHLIHTVHRVEEAFHLHRADRALRLCVTVADQAIQGQGSVRFTEKECQLDRLPFKPLAEGVCKFHVADGVGSNVDKLYGEAFLFDRLLRLVRRHFAFGTGNLIYRAVANKFDSFVHEFEAKENNAWRQWRVQKPMASRWQPHACASRLQNIAPRQRPLPERVGTHGGSRWPPGPMALEKRFTKIKRVRPPSTHLDSLIGACWPACSNPWRARVWHVRPRGRKSQQKQDCPPRP